jgi:hypothetical protein
MDTITLIISALVNGIVSEIAKDAYKALKTAILKKDNSINFEKLENNPKSKSVQNSFKDDLLKAGVDKDPEVVKLATGLLDLFETPKKSKKDSGNVEDIIETTQWNAGSIALKQVFEKHFGDLIKIRQEYPVHNIELLSSRIGNNQKLPTKVSDEIKKLHMKVRDIIQNVAIFIESRKIAAAEQAIEDMDLAHIDKQKAKLLVRTDKKINISYQTLKATVEYFKEINEMIRDRIETAETEKVETHLALANAILVCELTDYVINYIEHFSVDGYQDLIQMYEETRSEIDELKQLQKKLEKNANQPDVEPAIRDQALENIKSREESIQILIQEWENYVSSVKSLQNELGSVKLKLPTLKIIRDDAEIQIKVLQAVEMLRILKQNINTVENTIITLESIKLVSLSPDRVKRLLGVR